MIIKNLLKMFIVMLLLASRVTDISAADDLMDVNKVARINSERPLSLIGINQYGIDKTYSTAGFIDFGNAFFKQFGTNGRTCATCHVPTEGWTITPKGVSNRFEKTKGLDPIFRLVDGANSPLEDISTLQKRRQAYSMLLNKANIRVGIGIPADAEFELDAVDDPYGFASATELSLFRRPMPTTNLKFISAVMWEGRETTLDPDSNDCIYGTATCFSPVSFDLATQANHATLGHSEALADLTQAEREEIVTFEMGLFTAQVYDNHAGKLSSNGAQGGPKGLITQTYYFGINDTLAGDYRTRAPFDPKVMSLYDAWSRNSSRLSNNRRKARTAIARGEVLFNTKLINISGVKGINDDLGVKTLSGSCTTCHNTPNSGNHSIPMPLDIGISDASRRTPDMPLYTLRNKATGETVQTTDPGRAMITGKWKDIGRFKGPVLRALASRPPYFHDGSAKDLTAVVNFYSNRFGIGLSEQEKADLVAFLASL